METPYLLGLGFFVDEKIFICSACFFVWFDYIYNILKHEKKWENLKNTMTNSYSIRK